MSDVYVWEFVLWSTDDTRKLLHIRVPLAENRDRAPAETFSGALLEAGWRPGPHPNECNGIAWFNGSHRAWAACKVKFHADGEYMYSVDAVTRTAVLMWTQEGVFGDHSGGER